MTPRLLTGLAPLLVAACGGSEPPLVALPTENGVPYRLMLRTFADGSYADQPFHLLVKADGSSGEPKTVLRAAQCKNVSVGQSADRLYVFYGELALNGFASFQYQANEPRVVLCDLQSQECLSIRRQLIRAGTRLINVCSYRTSDGA